MQKIELIGQYSVLIYIFILVISIVLGVVTYSSKKNDEYFGKLKWLLIALRSLSFLMCFVLLISPIFTFKSQKIIKPQLVIGIDNSQSMVKFPSTSNSNILKHIYSGIHKIEQYYDIDTFTFGDQIQENLNLNFEASRTNISAFTNYIYNRYYHQNLDQILLITDGNINDGEIPFSEEKVFKQLTCVYVGDTQEHVDFCVQKVSAPDYITTGNDFQMEVEVSCKHSQSKKATLTVSENGKILDTKSISFSMDNELKSLQYIIKGDFSNSKNLCVSIASIGEIEELKSNNIKCVNVKAENKSLKIGILHSNLHPDIGAIKKIFAKHRQIEFLDHAQTNCDIYIIHNNINGINLTELQKKSCFVICGNSVNRGILHNIESEIDINSSQTELNPNFNKQFSQFDVQFLDENKISKLPPLNNSGVVYTYNGNAQNLLTSSRNIPMIQCFQTENHKMVLVNGEGLWRWRLYDQKNNGSNAMVDQIVIKLVEYLRPSSHKNKLKIFSGKNQYFKNENIGLFGEFYNANGELENVGNLVFDINGRKYNANKNAHAFQKEIGALLPGKYNISAELQSKGQTFQAFSQFEVADINLELESNSNNSDFFRDMAAQNAKIVDLNNLDQYFDELLANPPKQIIKYTKKQSLLTDWVLPLLILLGLLATEWIIRKFHSIL